MVQNKSLFITKRFLKNLFYIFLLSPLCSFANINSSSDPIYSNLNSQTQMLIPDEEVKQSNSSTNEDVLSFEEPNFVKNPFLDIKKLASSILSKNNIKFDVGFIDVIEEGELTKDSPQIVRVSNEADNDYFDFKVYRTEQEDIIEFYDVKERKLSKEQNYLMQFLEGVYLPVFESSTLDNSRYIVMKLSTENKFYIQGSSQYLLKFISTTDDLSNAKFILNNEILTISFNAYTNTIQINDNEVKKVSSVNDILMGVLTMPYVRIPNFNAVKQTKDHQIIMSSQDENIYIKAISLQEQKEVCSFDLNLCYGESELYCPIYTLLSDNNKDIPIIVIKEHESKKGVNVFKVNSKQNICSDKVDPTGFYFYFKEE